MVKATLLLEGGAARGVYTAGILDYLMKRDLYFSHIIGVSAGAGNAIGYVSKQAGRTRNCIITDDPELTYYYGVRESLKERSILNMDRIFEDYPKEIFPFDFETYFTSETHCEIVTTNLLTGHEEFMTEASDPERLLAIVRASCSLPLLAPIVTIDDIPYLDGGLVNAIPIKRAIELPNEKIVIILTRNEGYRKGPIPLPLAQAYRTRYRSYPNFVDSMMARVEYYNQCLDEVDELERQGKVFILRPTVRPISRMERDVSQMQMFYDHGYAQMERQYERLQEYLSS